MEKIDNYSILERMQKVASVKSGKELAEKLGVPASTLSNWKNKTSVPLDVLFGFSKKYDVDLNWLVTGNDPETKLEEMEVELLKRFKQLDFSQKLQVFNAMGNGNSNASINVSGNSGNYVGGDVKIGG